MSHTFPDSGCIGRAVENPEWLLVCAAFVYVLTTQRFRAFLKFCQTGGYGAHGARPRKIPTLPRSELVPLTWSSAEIRPVDDRAKSENVLTRTIRAASCGSERVVDFIEFDFALNRPDKVEPSSITE
jgi:hypothetical protein